MPTVYAPHPRNQGPGPFLPLGRGRRCRKAREANGRWVWPPEGGAVASTGVQQLPNDEAIPEEQPWMPYEDAPPEPGLTGGAMFTDVAYKAGKRMDPQPSAFEKLRYSFTNADLWDTLTETVMDAMLNPPEQYDPVHQRKVNVAVLTCIKTLATIQRMDSAYNFKQNERLEARVRALELGRG